MFSELLSPDVQAFAFFLANEYDRNTMIFRVHIEQNSEAAHQAQLPPSNVIWAQRFHALRPAKRILLQPFQQFVQYDPCIFTPEPTQVINDTFLQYHFPLHQYTPD